MPILFDNVKISGATIIGPTTLIMNLDAGNSSSYPGTGTTWTDLSGNGNNATLTSEVVYGAGNGGTLTMSYATSPGPAYGIVTNTSGQFSFSGLPFSVSMWVYPLDFGDNFSDCVFIDFSSFVSSTFHGWFFRKSGSNTYLTGVGGEQLSTVLPTVNTWTNVIFTSNGTNGKIYYNGTLNYTQPTITYSGNSVGDYGIGTLAWGPSNETMNAKYGQVGVYNAELSSTDVSTVFGALRGRYGV